MLKRGERVGDWVVDDTLGEGGMGAVYRVHSALTPRLTAALKVLKPTADPEARARFVREAEALSALRHPAIVHVMGFGEEPGRGLLYLVMELAVGETLKARMDRGPMAIDEAVRVFTRLASALEHAHFAGVYHRDLKPANVVLCSDGSVRLVDFGIAATQTAEPLTEGGHIGTVSYVPPEVFRSEKADPRAADVYAFGLLLHEALVGKRMFPVERGLSPAAAAASVGVRKLAQQPFDPGQGVPDRVREIVSRATDSMPGTRPDMTSVRKTLVSLRERRGQADASERTPIPSSMPRPILKPSYEEHTMRVPEPPRQGEDEGLAAHRVREKPPRRGLTPLLAGAGGLLLLGGVVAGISRSDGKRPVPDRVQASEPSPAAPVSTAPPLTIPTPIPVTRRTVPAATPVPTAPPSAAPNLTPGAGPDAPRTGPEATAATAQPSAAAATRPSAAAPPATAPRRPAPSPSPVAEEDDIPTGAYRPPSPRAPSPEVEIIEVEPEIIIAPEPEASPPAERR